MSEVQHALASLPPVAGDDLVEPHLQMRVYLANIVDRALDATPVSLHRRAGNLRRSATAALG